MQIQLKHITRCCLPVLVLILLMYGCGQSEGPASAPEGSRHTGTHFSDMLKSGMEATRKAPPARFTYSAISNNSPAENGSADTAHLRRAIESVLELNVDAALAKNRYLRKEENLPGSVFKIKYLRDPDVKSTIELIEETKQGDTTRLTIVRSDENQLFQYRKTYRVTFIGNKITAYSQEAVEKPILKEPFKWQYSLKAIE